MPDPPLGIAREQYSFLSLCAGERNFVRCAYTPVVYRELEGGQLIWGGSLEVAFKPDQLRQSSSGLLFHPSPTLPPRRGQTEPRRPYGAYSLLSSRLVIAHLESKIDDDTRLHWDGAVHGIAALEDGDAIIGRWKESQLA